MRLAFLRFATADRTTLSLLLPHGDDGSVAQPFCRADAATHLHACEPLASCNYALAFGHWDLSCGPRRLVLAGCLLLDTAPAPSVRRDEPMNSNTACPRLRAQQQYTVYESIISSAWHRIRIPLLRNVAFLPRSESRTVAAVMIPAYDSQAVHEMINIRHACALLMLRLVGEL